MAYSGHGKQFTLFSIPPAPNPWKVAVVLEELGLNYETKYLDFSKGEHLLPEYTKINPCGQVPALIDHYNGDFTVWDSSAIVSYLVDKYDKDHKFSVESDEDKAIMQQWIHFQNSGQGTTLLQLYHFAFAAPEKSPLAIKRYQAEVIRVYTVLDGVLKKLKEEGKIWLVGNKLTVADLGFIMWNHKTPYIMSTYEGQFNFFSDFPYVAEWHKRMTERPAVKKVLDEFARIN